MRNGRRERSKSRNNRRETEALNHEIQGGADRDMKHKYKKLTVQIIELEGSGKQIGREQGRQLKELDTIDNPYLAPPIQKGFQATEAVNALRQYAPHLLEELEGLSEGSGMPFDEILARYSGYDVEFPEMGCTALIQDSCYVRNYDFHPAIYDARLVFNRPERGYASVGFSQQIIGRLDGMNEKGLVVGLHFVNQRDHVKGFLAPTIVRILLDQCANTQEAIALIKELPHGFSYNYSMTDQSGNSVVVEASPRQQRIREGQQLQCTNYFQNEELKHENKPNIQISLERQEVLNQLIHQELNPTALFQAFNNEESPLFYQYYQEFFGTLHTVVYQPNTLQMIAGVGGNSEPITLSLKGWLNGTAKLPSKLIGKISNH